MKKMIKDVRKIYEDPKWRAGISTVLTALVGISLACLGDWSIQQNGFVLKMVVFLVILVIDLCYVIYCAAQDTKEHALSLMSLYRSLYIRLLNR